MPVTEKNLACWPPVLPPTTPSWDECFLYVDRNAFERRHGWCHLSGRQDGTVEVTDLLYEYCDTVHLDTG
jgi:hypothetical protein